MDSLTDISSRPRPRFPCAGRVTHDAPAPVAVWRGHFTGLLQWALEGPGWGFVRPTVDFVLLCGRCAVVAALGGVEATLHVSPAERARCWRCRSL